MGNSSMAFLSLQAFSHYLLVRAVRKKKYDVTHTLLQLRALRVTPGCSGTTRSLLQYPPCLK